MMRKITYAIGDMHGMAYLYKDLKRKISDDARNYDRVKIVTLGDYVDRGAHVRELIQDLSDPIPGVEQIFLRGNHEQSFIDIINNNLRYEWTVSWLYNGGVATLESYDIDVDGITGGWQNISRAHSNTGRVNRSSGVASNDLSTCYDFIPPDICSILHREILFNVPNKHLDFFRNTKLTHYDGDYMFVHAGVNPWKSQGQQTMHDFLWIRDDFLNSPKRFDYVVIHGHSHDDHPVVRTNRIGIDTHAYQSGVLTAVALTDCGRFYFLNT